MLCQCPALLCQCLTPPCSANALTCDAATRFALPARWTASVCRRKTFHSSALPSHWCPEPCFAPAFQVSATAFCGHAPAIRCCAFTEAVTFCSMPALNTAFQCHSRAGPSDAFAVLCCSVRAGPLLAVSMLQRARHNYADAQQCLAGAELYFALPMPCPA